METPEGKRSRESTAALRVVLIYAVFAGLWILLSDRFVVLIARDAAQIAYMSTVKGWLFVGVTSLLLYRTMRSPIFSKAEDRRGKIRRLVSPAVILAAFILVLTWAGIHQVYRQQETREDARLQAIADLKARQITDWVRERMADAQFAATSEVWSKAYYAWTLRRDEAERLHLVSRLEAFRTIMGFQSSFVLDDHQERVFLGTRETLKAGPELKAAAAQASRDRKLRLVGPYRQDGALHLDFLAPMPASDGHPGPLLVLSVDPATHMMPLLQTWPVPSRTGEAILFHRHEGQIQYLSESRFFKGLAGVLRRPAEEKTLLSAMILRGEKPLGSFIKGTDYRGEAVAGVVQGIPGTDWFLAAKIDQSELDAAARGQVAFIALAGLLSTFLAALATHLFRQQRILAEGERHRGLQAERLRVMQESGLRFRQLFEAAPVPMCFLGEGDRMVAINGQFTRTFGYALEDVPAEWLRERPRPETAPVESTVTCLDGEQRTVLISATAIGEEYLITLSDITERVRAEAERQRLQAEVQQAQKMDSIGRLAGGVAHDFNNMLGVIVANAEIGLLSSSPGNGQERFEEIKKAALRSADLTRQLLAFARKQTVSPRVINLNEAIPGMLQMLARLIGENITLDYTQRAGLWKIRMDPTQVDQILANLAVNARDAITGIGEMKIHTENVEIGEGRGRPGPYVVLEVGDNGCGISPEQMKHIFEPFFTTKGVGKGTGLGLATVYGIVKQNDGFIEVESAVGKGTTFRVHLPRYQGDGADVPETLPAGPSRGGRERILVVEDEVMNLEVTGMLLETLGYDVLKFASPGEALQRLGETPDIGMLLTDIIMPEMNGRELAERARELHPGLKCLYMSGYTSDVIAHHGVLDGEIQLLGKPFTLEDLAAAVRDVLDN